jgi:hypothetical protein
MKKKLIYISFSRFPSKTANSIQVYNVCQAIANHDIEVVLLAPKFYDLDTTDIIHKYYSNISNNIQIEHLPFPNIYFKTFIYAYYVTKSIIKHKPDYVYGRYIFGCLIAAILKIDTIIELHTTVWKSPFKRERLYYHIARKMSYIKSIVVISHSLKQLAINHCKSVKNKIVVLHDAACDDNKISNSNNLHTDWKGRNDSLQVGYFGHLYGGRGIEIIIELSKRLSDMDFHVFGGNDVDVKKYSSVCYNKNINFYGFIKPSNVKLCMSYCDILLAPYQKKVNVLGDENSDTSEYMSPLKIFEYMSSKKTIVSSKLPVLEEVLNKYNCLLIKNYESVDEWVLSLISLRDKDLRDNLAEKAYEDFVKNYTYYSRGESIISIFANV